jgi:hypothetical protein
VNTTIPPDFDDKLTLAPEAQQPDHAPAVPFTEQQARQWLDSNGKQSIRLMAKLWGWHPSSVHRLLSRMAGGGPRPDDCELCGRVGPVCFDHCHKTGKFRGWLCRGCNSGLGQYGDDVEGLQRILGRSSETSARLVWLQRALDYLVRRSETSAGHAPEVSETVSEASETPDADSEPPDAKDPTAFDYRRAECVLPMHTSVFAYVDQETGDLWISGSDALRRCDTELRINAEDVATFVDTLVALVEPAHRGRP